MKKKLGPLELWQWAALGAAAGVLLLLYNRRRGSDAAAASVGSPADARYDVGPIDPTTGLPFASVGGGGGGLGGSDPTAGIGQNLVPLTLADELNDLGMIIGLISGLQGVTPAPVSNTTAATTQDNPAAATGTSSKPAEPAPGFHKGHRRGHEYYLTGVGWVSRARYAAATAKTKVTKPKTNPGHIVETKSGGKVSARSTAPHSPRQHTTVAPPAHQRHDPTSHPSKPKAHIEHGAPAVKVKRPAHRVKAEVKKPKRGGTVTARGRRVPGKPRTKAR